MLDLQYSSDFKKDIKRVAFQGLDLTKLFLPIAILLNEQPLPPQYKDHPLKGKLKGYRELHVAFDWLLVYKKTNGVLTLANIGTHAELFDE